HSPYTPLPRFILPSCSIVGLNFALRDFLFDNKNFPELLFLAFAVFLLPSPPSRACHASSERMTKIASTAAQEDSSRSRLPHLRSALSASVQISDRLHPKRNPHSWFLFRLFLGFFGAALVLLPLALPESWIGSIFGLAFFLTSILLPPKLKSHEGLETSPAP